jgi:ABC-type bacteriocin/lantibiotic exporter with double-glycine peptidase domain
MGELLRQIVGLHDRRIYLWLGVLVLSSLAAAILESSGLGLLFLLFKIVVSPEILDENARLAALRDFLGATTPKSFVIVFCGLLFVLFLVKSALLVFNARLRPQTEWRIRRRLSVMILDRYLRRPYVEIARRNSSDLITNIITNVGQVAFSTIGLADLLGESLLVLAINATLLYLQPILTLAAIGVFALASLAYAQLVRQRSRRWGQQALEAQTRIFAATTEPIVGIKQVKTSGIEAFFLAAFRSAYEDLGKVSRRSTFLAQSLRPVLELLITAVLLGAILALLLSGRPLTEIVPVIALFGAAAYRLLPSVVRINQVLQSLHFARSGIAAVHTDLAEVLHAPPPALPPLAAARARLAREIRLEHVTFRYPGTERDTLTDVSLVIPRGESVGIVGSSGAGKTTLVDIVLNILSPDSGIVLLDGAPLDPRQVPLLFSYVPQDSFLINDTLRRNIALGEAEAAIDDSRLAQAIVGASLNGFVDSLPGGVDTLVGERGVRLSGGQRQRIAIARAIYRNSDVLVLDESTSALDSLTEAAVAEAIQKLRGARTLIIIAHRLSTVRNCSRLFFLQGGRVVDEGSFSELKQRNAAFGAMVREMELSAREPSPATAAQ